MSDYFGALMRSSGMTIGGLVPETAHGAPSAVESDVGPAVVENVEPGQASIPSRAEQAASPLPQAAVIGPVEKPVPPAPVPDTAAHGPQARFTVTAQAEPRAAENTAADSKPARAVETPKPALGEAPLHAAMRWVAADPQQLPKPVQAAPPIGRPLPGSREENGINPATQAFRERGAEARAKLAAAMPTTAAAPDLALRAPAVSQATPIPPAAPIPAAPPRQAAPLDRDEVVEISIGAIHVRVDAPAVQTIARPAATPPATAPGVVSAPPRSALARRALRRI